MLQILTLSVFTATQTFAIDPGCQTTGGIKSPLCSINEVGKDTKLPSYVGAETHPDAIHSIEPGVSSVNSAVFFALDAFKLAISSIAVIVIIIASIRLVSHSTDEQATKAKMSMLYGVIGLLVIQLADPIVREMFFGEAGDAFDAGNVEDSAEATVTYIRGIIGFVQLFLGSAAVLVLVIRGFTMIHNPGDEEEVTKAKKHVIYAIVGLVVVALSEVIVKGFVFPENGTALPDPKNAAQILASVTNYVSRFVGILAFISLFFSGYRYVMAGGEEEVVEKVKKTVIGSVIAIVLAFSAFAIVNTLVTLDNTDESPSSNQPTP